MVSFKSLLAVVPLLAVSLAQSTSKIAFTSTPAVAETGKSYNITWGGGDGTAVTLTLRRGDPNNLNTVNTIGDSILANYYVWNVPTVLQAGNNYALQITQGQSDINYSGLFTITAGSGTNSTTTAASNSSSTITSMASASGTGTAMIRNSTFSTATLTASNTNTFGATSKTASRTSATAAATTTAPSNDAHLRTGSSAALILGIVAAVMLH